MITVLEALAAVCFIAAPPDAVASSSVSPYAVEVSGRRLPDSADPSASAALYDRYRIDRELSWGGDLTTLAESAAGVHVLDLGGPLHPRRLSVRGGSSSQVKVVVDGVPIEAPFATGVDIGVLDLASLSRVELVRGGASAAYGSGALTGVLVARTRRHDEQPHGQVSLRFGTLGTAGVRAAGGAKGVSATARFERVEGAFEYDSQPEGLAAVARDRVNNDARVASGAVRGDFDVGGGQLSMIVGAGARDAGVPGFALREDVDARQRRLDGRARVAWSRPAAGDALGLRFGAYAALLGIAYDDPDLVTPVSSRTRFVTSGGDASVDLRAGRHHLTGSVDFGADHSRSTEYGERVRGRGGLTLVDDYTSGPWSLRGALRGELIGPTVLISPRAGVRWEVTPSVSLRAGVGRSTRVPTFDELYHPSQRGLVGNPELVPEAAWEAEVGVEHRRRRFSVGASLFARRIENTILYVNRNAFVIRPENLGVSHAAGAELDADGRLDLGPVRCRGEVSATLLASRLSDTSAPLPTRPPLIVDARLSLEPKIASRRPLEVFSRIRHASETKANLQNTIVVDPYLRWDAGVVVRPASGVVASLLVTNLLDDRGLVTVNKVPLPGRTVLASVTIKEVSL